MTLFSTVSGTRRFASANNYPQRLPREGRSWLVSMDLSIFPKIVLAVLLITGCLTPPCFGTANSRVNLGRLNDPNFVEWLKQAAEQGDAETQCALGLMYSEGKGVPKNDAIAFQWLQKAAIQGNAVAQSTLGLMYSEGRGTFKDDVKAIQWYQKAAEQGYAAAQFNLSGMYFQGRGVPQDDGKCVEWCKKAAEQDYAFAEHSLGLCYLNGLGVRRDYVESYKWFNLAAAQGHSDAQINLQNIERLMTRDQIAEAQRLTRAFRPRKPSQPEVGSSAITPNPGPTASGSGFFITGNGFLVTNAHVVKGGSKFKLATPKGLVAARLIKADEANDIALLKAEGQFTPLPIAASRSVRLGSTVATVGFPNIGLQGFSPKLAKGEIAAMAGPQDDPRYFQISVPVQPGNSGGALVDELGNVVGIVSAKLSAKATLSENGTIPENVNYAVKSGFLLTFLESWPEIIAEIKNPNTNPTKFEDVAKSTEQAAALVLVY